MARDYKKNDFKGNRDEQRRKALLSGTLATAGALGLAATPMLGGLDPSLLFALGAMPAFALAGAARNLASHHALEHERQQESIRRGGKDVLGMPPVRDCIADAVRDCRSQGKQMIDKYLIGFEVDSGEPIWIGQDELCTHAAVFAKTGVGKTLWLESLIFQQMARGRASGCTFIDAKRDSGTLAHIILMALITGRIEDLIVIDPFDTVHTYNFCLTDQRSDVKARKVLRAGLPPTSDQSVTKHYDRLAADAIYRMVRAMESFGLAWSIRDVAVALSAFNVSYPHLRNLLHKIGARQAMVELGHLAASYRNPKGMLDSARITDNLRGIASELHAIAGSETGQMFCTRYSDLTLTDAILRGKIIYFMLPRLEEAETAARMVKIFREDLEVSIGEITSSRHYALEDPHLVVIDEGSSTFGPTWANLFELARKGRFALLFGAQSAGGLTDQSIGLSKAFYDRVMANVNLKVTMRVGDNQTAADMSEWIGKVSTTKRTIGSGVTYSRSGSEMRGAFDLDARRSGGESASISISEDEEDLVSPEELKHEMSAEKGLAWFDLGDGRMRKGRCLWFDSAIADSWRGREFITRLERFENDEIGLADWVDEQILSMEQQENSGRFGAKSDRPESSSAPETETKRDEERIDDGSPFRISLLPGGRNRGRVSSFAAPAVADPSKEAINKEQINKEQIGKEQINREKINKDLVKTSAAIPPKDSTAVQQKPILDSRSAQGGDRKDPAAQKTAAAPNSPGAPTKSTSAPQQNRVGESKPALNMSNTKVAQSTAKPPVQKSSAGNDETPTQKRVEQALAAMRKHKEDFIRKNVAGVSQSSPKEVTAKAKSESAEKKFRLG